MDPKIMEKAQAWANNPAFDVAFRQEIQKLLDQKQEEELTDRFYKDLEFGTGGLRGILGAGSNRMNTYTVRRSTQGLADYIKAAGIAQPSVAIAHDSRRFSPEFTREAASVLAANGIVVHVFAGLRPTPMLSYAVRHLQATAGIVITASHNPAEYNGYKVSWSDGCQVSSPQDQGIIDRVNAISDFGKIQVMDYQQGLDQGLIRVIGSDLEEAYYQKVLALAQGKPEDNAKLGLVFTPLHGAGMEPVRRMLKARGFTSFKVVKEQEQPDGNFPTVSYPNPEEVSALELAQKTAGPEDQLILATDPDADRLGVMVRQGLTWVKLTGNQIGQLLFFSMLSQLHAKGKLPKDGVFVTTIVTSTLGAKIAAHYGLKSIECLTGFKYIGGVMRELEESKKGTFVFGCEESHGYLFGDFVRDKDGVMAAMLFAELAAQAQAEGSNLLEKIDQMHRQFGYHSDSLINQTIKGKAGAERINQIMAGLRQNPPRQLGGTPVLQVIDYETGEIRDLVKNQTTGKTTLPQSNVLAFYLEDGSRITARPSGTEPKIKYYFNLCGKDQASLDQAKVRYEQEFTQLIEQI